MYTVYHNPRCKKSRSGLAYLEEKGFTPTVIEYLKDPISEIELKGLLKKLNKEPSEIIRTQEEYYKKELKGKEFTKDELIKILINNPKLIPRPIVVKNNKAVIGDPVENIDSLI